MKKIYLAAPFFDEPQLRLVTQVEEVLATVKGLSVYSPRHDGVLKDMTPAQRAAAAPGVFKKNVSEIFNADGMVALLDHKDTGTIWEMGLGYGMRYQQTYYPIIGLISDQSVSMNVMLRQCLDATVTDIPALKEQMAMYATAGRIKPAPSSNLQVY